jgi:ribosomal protein L40E
MGLFSRKPKDAKQLCHECGQLNEPDAVECDMCGAELRDTKPEERFAPGATQSR